MAPKVLPHKSRQIADEGHTRECDLPSKVLLSKDSPTTDRYLRCVGSKRLRFAKIPGVRGTQPWLYRDIPPLMDIKRGRVERAIAGTGNDDVTKRASLQTTLDWIPVFKKFAHLAQQVSAVISPHLPLSVYTVMYKLAFENARMGALELTASPKAPLSRYGSRFLRALTDDAVFTTSICEIMPREQASDIRVGTYFGLLGDGAILTLVPALADTRISFGLIHATKERVDGVRRLMPEFGIRPLTEQTDLFGQMRFAVGDAMYNLSLLEKILSNRSGKDRALVTARFERIWNKSGVRQKSAFVAAMTATLNYQQAIIGQYFITAARGVVVKGVSPIPVHDKPASLDDVLDNLVYLLNIKGTKSARRVMVRLRQARENYASLLRLKGHLAVAAR